MSESRIDNSKRNAMWGMVCYAVTLLLSFVNRTIFVYFLGVDYLGVNGLFSNVLTLLSFAELGVGNAIIFNLYKPLAQKNVERIKTLMLFFKKAYITIGCTIAAAGLILIPFLRFIIKEKPNISDNLYLIYVLFLANTVISYFFSYKRSLIVADQKMYLSVIVSQFFEVMRVVLQMIVLIFIRNYVLYLSISILCTFLNNVFIANKANKMYPYLKDKNVVKLEGNEKKSIFKDVKALFMYRLGFVALNGTDNLIISSICGISQVGFCSNYTMIIEIFTSAVSQITSSLNASVGNLNAIESSEEGERVFNEIYFFCFWVYSFLTAGLIVFLNSLVGLWLGEKMVLSVGIVIVLALHFYINGVHYAAYTFRTTMGYFVQGKYAPFCCAVMNIVLSIILGMRYGVFGIFLATIISKLLTINLLDPILVFKLGFKKSPLNHYLYFFFTTFIAAVTCFTAKYITDFIPFDGWIGFFVKVLAFTVIYNLIFLILFHKNKNFKLLTNSLLKKYKRA